MFPSVMAPHGSKLFLFAIPIHAPIILSLSALAGYLIFQIMGGGGPLTGLAFGGFFSLMSIGTSFALTLLRKVGRGCLGLEKAKPSVTSLILIFTTAAIAALLISFFMCNAISSLPHMTPLQGLALAGLTIGMFGAVNLIAYGCKRGYEPRPKGRGMIGEEFRSPPQYGCEIPGPKGTGFRRSDEAYNKTSTDGAADVSTPASAAEDTN